MIVGADCGERRRHRPPGEQTLRPLRSAPGLLFGVQPDPGRFRRPSAQAPAADARASPLPVGLADAFLRLRPERGRRGGRREGHASARHGSRSWPGRSSIATSFRSTSTGRRARLCFEFPGLGVKAVNALVASRRWRRLRLDDIGRLTVSIAKVRPFITTDDWRPVALLDRADLGAMLKPPRAQLELF